MYVVLLNTRNLSGMLLCRQKKPRGLKKLTASKNFSRLVVLWLALSSCLDLCCDWWWHKHEHSWNISSVHGFAAVIRPGAFHARRPRGSQKFFKKVRETVPDKYRTVSKKFPFKNSKFYKECLAHWPFCHPAIWQFSMADSPFNIACKEHKKCTNCSS